MCGIAGIVKRAGRGLDDSDRVALRSMVASMHHRGPDAQGMWESSGGACALGHARLSIIDVAGSPQPMRSERAALTYNGEVYNFRELRGRLVTHGRRFDTDGDTEVVLESFNEWGVDALDHFDGMFALGHWSEEAERLILARDPFGVKPLYYALVDDALLFASELTALRLAPGVDGSIADDAVIEYLRYGYIPSPKTILRGVCKLPPGHRLIFDRRNDRVTVERYWTPSFEIDASLDERAAADLLDDVLSRSVGMQLVSDVPVGAFLSGGIDSSLVVAYMVGHGNRKAFAGGFTESRFDESPHAEAVARHVGADLTTTLVRIDDGLRLTERLAGIYDEPFADSSALPTFMVCGAIREHVTVALSGDGADEILGGYERYQRLLARLGGSLDGAPRPGTALFGSLSRLFPNGSAPRRRLADLGDSPARFYERTQRYFSEEHLARVLRDSPAVTSARASLIADHVDAVRSGRIDAVTAAQLCDIATYLPEDCLTKVDRASMAHSLEVRVPFLSKDVWSVARRLPLALRVGSGEGRNKVALRALAARRLPEEIVRRPKKGFSIPAAEWFRSSLRERLREVVLDSPLVDRYLSRAGIERLIREHDDRSRNHQQRLWNLMMLGLWDDVHRRRTSYDTAARRTIETSDNRRTGL